MRGATGEEIARKTEEAAALLGLGQLLEPQARRLVRRPAPARGARPCHRSRAGCFLLDEPLSNLDAQLRAENAA